jgi:hypothetical protein
MDSHPVRLPRVQNKTEILAICMLMRELKRKVGLSVEEWRWVAVVRCSNG